MCISEKRGTVTMLLKTKGDMVKFSLFSVYRSVTLTYAYRHIKVVQSVLKVFVFLFPLLKYFNFPFCRYQSVFALLTPAVRYKRLVKTRRDEEPHQHTDGPFYGSVINPRDHKKCAETKFSFTLFVLK